ncbi:MAG: hypothetical protein GY817_09190 [bacterium]|nr:hypothetical protein [bacterium]
MDIKKIYRICDANLNRAKEGLRVVEDYLRFYLENDDLVRKAREIRHGLGGLISHSFYKKLVAERDVFNDCGFKISEVADKDLETVLLANIKRAEEALRVLEEYFKIIAKNKVATVKTLRYKFYNLEKGVYDEL